MKKEYRSESQMSIALLVSGVTRKIQFRPVMNYLPGDGGSRYVTESEEVQAALESRAAFGTKFWLESVDGVECSELENAASPDNAAAAVKELEHVKVESLADAKAWLVDNKGWAPKSRISKKSLIDTALEYGVSLEIGE